MIPRNAAHFRWTTEIKPEMLLPWPPCLALGHKGSPWKPLRTLLGAPSWLPSLSLFPGVKFVKAYKANYLQQIGDALEMDRLRNQHHHSLHGVQLSGGGGVWQGLRRMLACASAPLWHLRGFARKCWGSSCDLPALQFPCSDADLISVLCDQVGNAN